MARRIPDKWIWLGLAIALAALLAPASADKPTWDQLKEHYRYDSDAPLDCEADEPVSRGPFTVQKVRFKSTNDQLVPATLCVPNGADKAPVVLFLHGLGGDSSSSVNAAAPFLCPMGLAVLSIDAQYHGQRKVEGKALMSVAMDEMIEGFRQTIVDNRRALDYIATRKELDADRIYLVGASLGGIMGSMVTALDGRIKSALLVVGGGDLVTLFGKSQIDEARAMRARVGDIEPYRDALEYIEPVNFAGHIAPRPVQMLNGKTDLIVLPECGQALFDACRDPKQITWFETEANAGHVPPIQAIGAEIMKFMKANSLLPAPKPAGGANDDNAVAE